MVARMATPIVRLAVAWDVVARTIVVKMARNAASVVREYKTGYDCIGWLIT